MPDIGDHTSVNDVVAFAFSRTVWVSKAHRAVMEEKFPAELLERMDAILHDAAWPAEPWVSAKSLQEAATAVEPVLRERYPELSEESVGLVLNCACFSWK